MACGAGCLGDDLLRCTASAATVEAGGCAISGPGGLDAGQDAGFIVHDEQPLDAGPPECAPSSTCTCTIKPYETGSLTITIPCCSTLCVASQADHAWACSASGATEVVPALCNH